MTCSARHQFTTDPPGDLATCIVAVPHTLHRDERDREWRLTPSLAAPITPGLAHGERYGRVLVAARQHHGNWVVEVTDACESGVVFAVVPDLTEFEAGREFQRQVDIWRPIGIEQSRAYLQGGV